MDSAGVFAKGFIDLSINIDRRHYTSILDFASDFSAVIANVLRISRIEDEAEGQAQINGASPTKNKLHPAKGKKASAKRIIKAVQGPLEDAIRKESQLYKVTPDGEIQKVVAMLEHSLIWQHEYPLELDSRNSIEQTSAPSYRNGLANGDAVVEPEAPVQDGSLESTTTQMSHKRKLSVRGGVRSRRTNGSSEDVKMVNGTSSASSTSDKIQGPHGAYFPAASSHGGGRRSSVGVPWYMQNFLPDGTTIEEEHWTGRDLVRAMSEDLSDMDDEEMSGLVEDAAGDKETVKGDDDGEASAKAAVALLKKKKAAAARRRRGWSRR